VFGQNVTEHNPAPSPSGHPLLSGSIYLYLSIYLSLYPPTLNDIHQIFTSLGCPFFAIVLRCSARWSRHHSLMRLVVVSMLTSSAASLHMPPAPRTFYTTVPYYTTIATHARAWRAPIIRLCKAEGEAQSSKAEIAAEIKRINFQVQMQLY
jgi:hypothetical protein